MKRILLALLLISTRLDAQVPAPGKTEPGPVLIYGATVHTGNGKVYLNASVKFDRGKITGMDSLPVSLINYKDYRLVDATGKHVYPGLIAVNSTLGLNEIDMVRSTRDYQETGVNNSPVRSIIAYNTDSKVIPTLKSNGILLAQVTPTGGTVCGNSSVVQLDAWNWEDAAVKTDDALYINWPETFGAGRRKGEHGDPGSLKTVQELQDLRDLFSNARSYCLIRNTPVNLHYEAFRKVFSGEKKVFVRVGGARETIQAVRFLQEYGITPVITGGGESYLITRFLRENKVPVVLLRTHNLPALPEDDVDLPYRLPAILRDSGVLFCITDHGAWQQRNLPFEAGTAVAFGLTREQALSSITLNTARILGIDQVYGSLEVNKSATLIISEGDILDTPSSRVMAAWIDGRPVDLHNSQKALDLKYRKKYFGE